MCLHVLTIKWEISGELSMILGSFLGLNEKVPEFNAGIFCIGNHVYIYITAFGINQMKPYDT